MYDANGEHSNAVTYKLESDNTKRGSYVLTVTADKNWINSEDRAFPVTVDPTIVKYHTMYNGGRIKDTYVNSANPSKAHGSYAWLSIDSNSSNEHIAMLGIADESGNSTVNLPAIPKSSVVTYAELKLRARTDSATGVTIGAYQMTSDWNSYEVTYNTMPSHEPQLLDYFCVNTAGSEYTLNITSAMQRWYNEPSGEYSKKGLKLIAINGSGHVKLNAVNDASYNASYPMFVISYHDAKGLEGIWSFASHGAGNAGVGNVNTFNGNLVLVHDDTDTKGTVLPVTVSHVYNSFMSDNEFTSGDDVITASFANMKIGKGWKLSVQETVVSKSLNGETWYVLNDSDGTELYFMPETIDGYHLSEDGYPIKLRINSSGTYKYEIYDDYGNAKYFNSSGMLLKMADAFGNVKNFVYTNNRLTSITSTPNGSTTETQVTFTYNSANALQKITNGADSGDYTTFYYSTTYNGSVSSSYSGFLRKVVSTKNGTCLYEYNSDGTLKNTTDNDTSYKIEYTYIDYQGIKRVATVTEKSGSTTGQKIGFGYADKKTVIRVGGSDDVYGNSDDILTTYLFDDYGKTVCSYSSDISGNEVYGAAYAQYNPTIQASKQNNKIVVDTVKGQTVENLVLNSNCESTSSWYGAYSGSGYSCTLSSTEKCVGVYSFAFASSTTANGYYRRYQNVSIPEAGTYTLSAYVKTSNVVSGTNGGAYMILDGAESEKVTGTTNTAIQDGWRRISVTKTFSSATTVQVQLQLANASGNAYFDCIQLEKGEVNSKYNLIQNGGMTLTSGWSSAPNATATGRGNVMKVEGNIAAYNYKSQTVALNIPKETTLVLSGWGKADSVPTGTDNANHNRTFRVVANILYADNTREDQAVDFNENIKDWQYSAAPIVPKKDIKSITIYLSYDFNGNTAYFDDICLTIEPVQTYTYDDNGNITSTISENGNQSLFNYAANGVDLATFTNIIGEKYTYTYKTVGSVNTHAVETIAKKDANDNTLQSLTYGYDNYGNAISSTLSATGIDGVVKSTATYTGNGNFLSSVTDSLGSITSYGYSSTKLLSYVQNANANRTGYLYDSRNRNIGVYLDRDKDGIADSNEEKVQYTYTNNRLTTIVTATTTYTLSYDAFGNMTQVKAGSNTLATYNYRAGNGKLLRMIYGNGDYEDYIYDNLDRLKSVKYNGITTYTLTYNTNGALAKCDDAQSGITHTYEYDSLGRLIRAWQTTAAGVKTLGIENVYDSYGRADKSTYTINNKTLSYDISYKQGTNLVSSILMPTSSPMSAINYTYDNFDRLTKKNVSFSSLHDVYEEYGYKTYTSNGTTYTTPLISSLTFKKDSATTATYSYIYDNLGNITQISENGSPRWMYEYDSLGQLVREYNYDNSTAYLYTYDKSGNITGKYAFVGWDADVPAGHLYSCIGLEDSSDSYIYGNSSWGDVLTNYNGTSISYDSVGNPTNWRDGITNITWDGRKLTSLNKGSYNLGFSYNADGTRTSKTYTDTLSLDTITHDYILDGSKILKETVSGAQSYTNYYFYDESGNIAGLEYNGSPYYFQKNIQGDVIRICSSSGDTVVQYTYDAWGNILYITGSHANTIGERNPFRYRGYYYDTETGLYYVSSRYYDPETCRFINADSQLNTDALLGYNLFAYCSNNPVCFDDPDGTWKSVSGGWQAQRGDTLWGLSAQLYGNGSCWTSFGFGRDPKTLQVGEIIKTNTGNSVSTSSSSFTAKIRDVTNEVNRALAPYVTLAQNMAKLANAMPLYEPYRYVMFGLLVNHGAAWDIKRQGPWESTIGTSFPGVGSSILYCGVIMTPENLGNYTYGYLGAAFGISYRTLINGSVFAAFSGGSMKGPAGIQNEIGDWNYIGLGYLVYLF